MTGDAAKDSDPNAGESKFDNEREFKTENTIGAAIQLIRSKRKAAPGLALPEFLQQNGIDFEVIRSALPDELCDLACLDLMTCWRGGAMTKTESYVNWFESLARDPWFLDLIDAEICVAREVGCDPKASELHQRFPNQTTEIDQLIGLSDQQLTESAADAAPILSVPIKIQSQGREPSQPDSRQAKSLSLDLPIALPQWFLPEQCVAVSEFKWLVSGRDRVHGDAVAVKIIRLPVQADDQNRQSILDCCEAASMVPHSVWSKPRLASIDGRYLAVARNWLHTATPSFQSRCSSMAALYGDLSGLAFSLASAHRSGATHGGVCVANCLADQLSGIQLVDAVGNANSMVNWFEQGRLIDLGRRIAIDCRDFESLVRGVLMSLDPELADVVAEKISRLRQCEPSEFCAAAGDLLIGFVDRPPRPQSLLRRGLRRFNLTRTKPIDE